MKTLINKTNPQIRITAPEEAVKERPSCWAIWPEGYKGYRSLLLDKDNWTLVEEEPEKDGVRKLREDLTSYCISQIKNPTTAVTESGFKVERARRDAYADIDEHFGILAENLPDEIEEEPEVDLEKELVNWVKKYAPRLLELVKKEVIEKRKEE